MLPDIVKKYSGVSRIFTYGAADSSAETVEVIKSSRRQSHQRQSGTNNKIMVTYKVFEQLINMFITYGRTRCLLYFRKGSLKHEKE